MIEKKNGYMQLPPLPEELDGSLVHVLWEYAKLPEAERTATYKQSGIDIVIILMPVFLLHSDY